jgi:hypothetical protein
MTEDTAKMMMWHKKGKRYTNKMYTQRMVMHGGTSMPCILTRQRMPGMYA